jgi:hypothetical protein
LSDVADDREQIIACYEEDDPDGHVIQHGHHNGVHAHHNIGDGMSASSSSSPSSTVSPTHSPAFQNHKSGMIADALHRRNLLLRSPESFEASSLLL